MTHTPVRRWDPLLDAAPTVAARDLPAFGVRRKEEREAAGAYYLARGRVSACCGAKTAAVLEITVDLPGGEGRQVVATARRFDHGLVGLRCWFLLAIHDGPREGPRGRCRLHCHLLWVLADPTTSDESEDLDEAA